MCCIFTSPHFISIFSASCNSLQRQTPTMPANIQIVAIFASLFKHSKKLARLPSWKCFCHPVCVSSPTEQNMHRNHLIHFNQTLPETKLKTRKPGNKFLSKPAPKLNGNTSTMRLNLFSLSLSLFCCIKSECHFALRGGENGETTMWRGLDKLHCSSSGGSPSAGFYVH